MRANLKLLCVVGVVGAVVAGCSGKPFPTSAGSTSARLVSAVEKTRDAHTARVALTITFPGVDPNLGESAGGVVDFSSGALALTMRVGKMSADVRVTGGKIYTRTAAGPLAGAWESVDASTLHENATVGAASQYDPTQFLTYLKGVAGDVRVVGEEKVRDAETTHYVGALDLASLGTRVTDAKERAAIEQALNAFGRSAIPVDAWIDHDGRLRKLTLTVDVTDSGTGTTARAMTLSVEYYDFGVPVHIDAPAGASDVQSHVQDRAVQSDLRNALTAEKVVYTDNQEYDSSPDHMKTIESSLDWGGKLKAFVGNAAAINDIVCLQEQSASGTVFSIADVAAGPNAGTYYGTQPCPLPLTAQRAAQLGRSWTSISGVGSSGDDSSTATTVPAPGVLSVTGVERDLRDALTAEKTTYTDNQTYDASTANMQAIESSLDWGRTLEVSVGDAVNPGDKGVVCLWESTSHGQVFAIADVAAGPKAGTYYGHTPCGAHPSAAIAAFFGSSW